MLLAHSTTLADLSPVLLLEVFLLNAIIGVIAAQRYTKDGLVGAGVHFWTDVVWHVLWGLFS